MAPHVGPARMSLGQGRHRVRRWAAAWLLLPVTLSACAGGGQAVPAGTPASRPGTTLSASPSAESTPPSARALVGGSTVGTAQGMPSEDPAAARSRWDYPDVSVSTDPDDLLAGVEATERVRIVGIFSRRGRPAIQVTVARGRAEARAAVERAQRAPGALSVAVDSRVQALESVMTSPSGEPSDDPATPSEENPADSSAPSSPSASAAAAARAHDTHRQIQWALDRLAAEDLWEQAAASGVDPTGVDVAVLDTGVDDSHPDLAGAVGPGIDYVAPGGDGTADGHGHGTHVAGVIAAVANNGVGITGFAPGMTITPVRVLDDTGSGWDSDIAEGIVYAVDHGAEVINLSLGSTSPGVSATAVEYAVARGVVVLAAAGNERAAGNPVTYPAAYPDVIGVAASDRYDAIASFSNTGSYVDLTAPGVSIASTVPGGYSYMSGTSMATPYAAAVAGFLAAADPSLSPAQVTATLTGTADDLLTSGRDDSSGYGLVDPREALCAVAGCPGGAPSQDAARAAPRPTRTRLLTGTRTVPHGSAVPVTARVVDRESGAGIAGTPVRVCSRALADPSYTCRTHTTDSLGAARVRIRALASFRLYAAHPGTARTDASAAGAVTYRVVPRVRLEAGPRRLTATVRPIARQRVVLERWAGSRWVVRASTRATARGTAAFRGLQPGRYRVRVPAAAGLAAVATAPRRIR